MRDLANCGEQLAESDWENFAKRIGKEKKPRSSLYLEGNSIGSRSPTQLFRYTGVPRAYEERCAGRAAARAGEAGGDGPREQEGYDQPAVRRIPASVRAIPAGRGPVLGVGPYSEAARRCGE